MRRRGARSVPGLILIVLLAVAITGCGEDEKGFEDKRIIEALKLEKDAQGYTLGGDPFCVLTKRFFRGAGEVEAATGDEDTGVVVASRAGNVAVEGVPSFFGPDCKHRARKDLDKLDPAPAGE